MMCSYCCILLFPLSKQQLSYFLTCLRVYLQIFLARGLQLEKTSKVANIQYIEVVLLLLLICLHFRTGGSFIFLMNNFLLKMKFFFQ